MVIVISDEAERSYVVRRIWRRLRAIVGGVLLLVASLLAMAMVVLPLAWLVARFGNDEGSAPSEEQRRLAGDLGRACALVALITLSGWLTGKYLMRNRRGTALWLRRFRFEEATEVVSSALDYIGRSWRVVTLDDTETAAVGVASGLRLSSRLFGSAGRAVPKVVRVAARLGKLLWWACIAVIVAVAGWSAYQGEFFDLMDSVLGNGDPSDTTASRAVYVAGLILIGEFLVLIAAVVVMLGLLPLLGLGMLAGNLRRGVDAAETAKNRRVQTRSDVEPAAQSVATVGQGLLAPRLTVLEVDSSVWQETVTAVAEVSNVIVVDVSVVTENLLWELNEVTRRIEAPVVLVGERDHVEQIAAERVPDAIDPEAGARQGRMRELLEGRRILTYDTSWFGRIRFQRALFGELEATRPSSQWQPAAIRRAALAAAGVVGFCVGVAGAVAFVAERL